MRPIALDVMTCIACAGAFALSVRYFLLSKPVDDGPVGREHLIFGKIHPHFLVRALIAAAMTWSCWALSKSLASDGNRVIAGMVLASGVPAGLTLAMTLFVLPFAFAPGDARQPTSTELAVTAKSKWTARVLFALIVAAAAMIPFLR